MKVIKWFRIPKHLKQTTNPSFGCDASGQLSAKVSTPRDKSLGPTAVCTTTFICTTSQSSCRVNASNPRLLSRKQLPRQLVPLDVQAVHASVAALPSTHIRYLISSVLVKIHPLQIMVPLQITLVSSSLYTKGSTTKGPAPYSVPKQTHSGLPELDIFCWSKST